MKKQEIRIGDKVKAIFRKYGKHIVVGTVFEISEDKHALKGKWISLTVGSGDVSDKQVQWMIENKINVMVPLSDVLEVLQ